MDYWSGLAQKLKVFLHLEEAKQLELSPLKLGF